MMSKADYEIIASVFLNQIENLHVVRGIILSGGLDDTLTKGKSVTLETMAYNMVQKFYAQNERFDHKRFYEACGFSVVNNHPRVFPVENPV